MKKWLIALFAVIFVSGIIYFRFFNEKKENFNFTPTPTGVNTDATQINDTHGCDTSEGYVWCDLKNKCLRTSEEKCNDSVSVTGSVLNLDEISEGVKRAFVLRNTDSQSELEITVSKASGRFAYGTVNVKDSGGGLWLAVQEDNNWKILWDGNGIIECSVLKGYTDTPASMVPKCFDSGTGKILDR